MIENITKKVLELTDKVKILSSILGSKYTTIQDIHNINPNYVSFDNYDPFKNNDGDNSSKLILASSDAKTKGVPLVISKGNYNIDTNTDLTIDKDLIIINNGTFYLNDSILSFSGVKIDKFLSSDLVQGAKNVQLNSISNVEIGDHILIDGEICAEDGWFYPYKELHLIDDISSNTVKYSTSNNFGVKQNQEWKLLGDGVKTSFFVPYYYKNASSVIVKINGAIVTDYSFDEPNSLSNGFNCIFNIAPSNLSEISFSINDIKASIYKSNKLKIESLKIVSNLGGRINFTGLKNSIISNLEFKGQAKNASAINVYSCYNFNLQNANIQNAFYGISVGQSRECYFENISGVNLNHIILAENFADTIFYKNIKGGNVLNAVDAHPSFNIYIENVILDDINSPSMRCEGFTLKNVKSVNQTTLETVSGSISWIDNIDYKEFSFLQNAAKRYYSCNIIDCDLPKTNFSFKNFNKASILNSTVGSFVVEASSGNSNRSYSSNEIFISNSKLNKVTNLEYRLKINSSQIGQIRLGFQVRENIHITNSTLGISLDNKRVPFPFYAYGEFRNKGTLFISNTYITGYSGLFEYLEPLKNIFFNNCVFDSTPNLYNVSNYGNFGNIKYTDCFFQNSYGSLLNFTIVNGGSGYTNATITISDPTDYDVYEIRDGYKHGYDIGDNTFSSAVLQATITNGAITGYKIMNSGKGYYDANLAIITVSGDGAGAIIQNVGRYPEDRVVEKNNVVNFNDIGTKNNLGAIILSNKWLWIDSSNNLRTKTSAPISETDGTII